MTARLGYPIQKEKCKVGVQRIRCVIVRGHTKTNSAAMHRDTDELPAIMTELEEDVHSIEEAQ